MTNTPDTPTTTSTRDWQTWIWLSLIALAVAFFVFLAGFVAGESDDLDPSGHDGEVYVVDSGEWVDADDHAAHMDE